MNLMPGSKIKNREEIGRLLCRIRGQDPDERVQFPHPQGYAVACFAPAWELAAREMDDFVNKLSALTMAQFEFPEKNP